MINYCYSTMHDQIFSFRLDCLFLSSALKNEHPRELHFCPIQYPLWMVDLQKNYKHYDSPEIYFIFKFEDTKGTIKNISNRQCGKKIDKKTHMTQ